MQLSAELVDMAVASDDDYEKCSRKGRLTILYKMASVWAKNKDFIVDDDGPLPRHLKPCSQMWLRR